MILISITLYGITSKYRHYYIPPLNYFKTILQRFFFNERVGGGNVAPYQISGKEIFVRGRN